MRPAEKEQFVSYVCKRLRGRKLDVLVRNLFRPSYGGKRNFTLLHTLGEDEISRGKLIPRGANGHTRKSYDILESFRDILGKTVGEARANYDQGELIVDSAMNLESNT